MKLYHIIIVCRPGASFQTISIGPALMIVFLLILKVSFYKYEYESRTVAWAIFDSVW